jgi:hypothetical protein
VSAAYLQVTPRTDPASLLPSLDADDRPQRIQVAEPLTNHLLDAIAEALAARPDVALRFYGYYGGALPDDYRTLGWLERFSFIRDLSIELWDATSFDVLATFTELRRLSLGATKSTRPSLSFLRLLPHLESLSVEAHDRDFNVVGEASVLTQLRLRTPRVKSLEAIGGHAALELLNMDFGGIRDLTPLSSIPRLQALGLYQVRRFDTDDFDAIGACTSLTGISLGALRNVTNLAALAKGPRNTLRFLTIEHMLGLETLRHLGECEALEQVYLDESKPRDGRLDLVAKAPSLQHLVVADAYSEQQIADADRTFRGKTFAVRDRQLRGQRFDPEIITRWRTPVAKFLQATASAYRTPSTDLPAPPEVTARPPNTLREGAA